MNHPARIKYVAAGRRWRKTTLAMQVVVNTCLSGHTVLWGAPTYSQCFIGWEELKKACGNVCEFKMGRMEVLFPNGGKAIFRSLDNPDNARGFTAQGVIIDEAPLTPEEGWFEVIRPIISDTGGWALLMGTPKGRNWFWRESIAAELRTDSKAWQIPTCGVEIKDGRLLRRPHPLENPDFPFEEAVALWETTPERVFRQEFLAEFVDDAGGVFRGVIAAATAKGYDFRMQEKDEYGSIVYHDYVFGVDWGRDVDFTAISVYDMKTDEIVYQDRYQRIGFELQKGRLKELAKKFQPLLILAEANAMGAPLVEALQADGMPVMGFMTTAQSKKRVIEALSLAIEKGQVKIVPDKNLVAELQAYTVERLASGNFRYNAPAGMHDDTVISAALAYEASKIGTPVTEAEYTW